MLLLRILTLPIALFAFVVLYTLAIKAPAAVEAVSLLLWMGLLLALIVKLTRRIWNWNIFPGPIGLEAGMSSVPAQLKTSVQNGVLICAVIKDIESNFGNRVL